MVLRHNKDLEVVLNTKTRVSLEVFLSISPPLTFSSHKVFLQSCFWLIQLKRSNMSVWAQNNLINLKDHPGFYSWRKTSCQRQPLFCPPTKTSIAVINRRWLKADLGWTLTLQTAHWEHYEHSVFTPLYSSNTTLVTHSSIPSLWTLC